MSLDHIALRAIRARRQFKAIVRLVIANRHWLEDVEDEHLSENVKKNVQLLTKKKMKKGLLTLQQKAILSKPAEQRTDQEKMLLNKIIGGLKCFRKYPEHVKMQLAGITYFVYYGPGRVIVKQNHIAHALYFIVSGEVIVSITTHDPVLKETVTANVGTMVPGSMFGEVSLLHDIPRTATITTSTPCELLCLKKADFDIVLRASVKEQWAEIQRAMARFAYFDGWDDVAVRECCIYSKIKPFVRDQTILGDGEGIQSSTYFVLKGQCKLIEHLLISVTHNKAGKKKYKLYQEDSDVSTETEDDAVTLLDETKQSLTSLHAYKGLRSVFPQEMRPDTSSTLMDKSSSGRSRRRTLTAQDAVSLISSMGRRESRRPSAVSDDMKRLSTEREMVQHEPSIQLKKLSDKVLSDPVLPVDVETHFMQVCVFSQFACFGLGENMKRRRVVAMSDYVECLLIPRYWLFQHNKSNLWTRIQQYLDMQIPSTEMVFHEFINRRKWTRYRTHLATELFGKPPVTARYHIPYSIRINEDVHYD